jgi:putative Ca2+/H+ antiporter (TMEM165/GDT1 family)
VEAFLPALVACLLGETGGRVQMATAGFAVQRRTSAILAALLLSTLVSLAFGAAGGALIARMITYEARTLLLGLALIMTASTMFMRPRKATNTRAEGSAPIWRYLAMQLGDNSQFIVFAFAARGNAPALAVLGGLAATLAAAALPLALGADDFARVPLILLRRIAGALLLATGLWSALGALGLL